MQRKLNSEITGGFGRAINHSSSVSSLKKTMRFLTTPIGFLEWRERIRFRKILDSISEIRRVPQCPRFRRSTRKRNSRDIEERRNPRGIDKRPRDRRPLCRPDAKINISTRCKADPIFSPRTCVNTYWTLDTTGLYPVNDVDFLKVFHSLSAH